MPGRVRGFLLGDEGMLATDETQNGRFAILALVNDTEALKKTSTPLWVMDHD